MELKQTTRVRQREESPSCPTCGAAAPEGFRFCGQCGRALAAAFHPSPEGTVTVMFTDIEGFTSLLRSLNEDEAHELVHVHSRLVRECVQRHAGFEVKALGDGFMVVFTTARQAVRCAVSIQRALAEHNRQHQQRPLLVRIGINSGDTFRHEEDYFGLAVGKAARVTEKAHGGQILLSDQSRELAGPLEGVEYVERGRLQLRGFPGRHRLYEVVW
ncbi:MAG: adenylate/guanylate cyclase domain-containing protein [Chloroflexota bacterium]|nr:adenylate/guanylate cyclase domain-containing protein [Chloroflexota bacterium]